MKTNALKVIYLLFLAGLARAEGTLSLEPQHDFLQGNGGIFTLDGDAKLFGKWYIDPNAQLSTVARYRDANCALDLDYHWSEKIRTSVGAGYDSYHYFGDNRVESEDIHVKLKYQLWK